MSGAIPRVNSRAYLLPARAVTAILRSTRECSVWIVLDAIAPVIGLQATMVHTQALQMKVEVGSIMEEDHAGTVTHKPCGLRRARNATMETPKEEVVARAEGTIKFGEGIKHASEKDACFSSY